MKQAVILMSGGLDSSTIAYELKAQDYEIFPLIIDYNQRHNKEVEAAKRLAELLGVKPVVVKLDLSFLKTSSVTNKEVNVPKFDTDMAQDPDQIPSTYVPFRNSIFLSLAVAYAESLGVKKVYHGMNLDDFNNYPDCRLVYLGAFNILAELGTAKRGITVEAPLLKFNKQQIYQRAQYYEVPIEETWSCYEGKEEPCGVCEACMGRKKAMS